MTWCEFYTFEQWPTNQKLCVDKVAERLYDKFFSRNLVYSFDVMMQIRNVKLAHSLFKQWLIIYSMLKFDLDGILIMLIHH